MAIVKFHTDFRQLMPVVALLVLVQSRTADGQIKLSPGQVPIGDNELNSPIDEPQVTIQEHSSNAVMRPVPPEIQQSTDPLVKLVYDTREAQRRRLLSTAEHTPWQIMHGMLALREDFLIRHNGKPVNCLEWIQSGPTFEGEGWFEKTQVRVFTGRGGNQAFENVIVGRGHPYNKPYAFEGHINQFVAIMSMSGIPLDTQFQTLQGPVSMRDMLTYAKLTVNEKEEVTWTLWALSRYLPSDAEWINARGEKWSIERLVQIEVGKSLQGAPCGGTHGLFALAHARNVYLRTGKPLQGVWLQAEQKIRRYIQTARMQLNSDGSLSSNYFRGREYKQDFDKRMASSGHILEFLMMALPSRELNDPWVRRAIEATTNDLMANRKSFVSCSPLYHATSALSIYLDRVAKAAPNIAQGAPKTHTISNSKEILSADASQAHPESIKSPVMESSGVDSNGAPKVFTGPEPKTPAAASTTPESESTPTGSLPTNPQLAPTPLETIPLEATPKEEAAQSTGPKETTTKEPAPAEGTPGSPAAPEGLVPTPIDPVPAQDPAPVPAQTPVPVKTQAPSTDTAPASDPGPTGDPESAKGPMESATPILLTFPALKESVASQLQHGTSSVPGGDSLGYAVSAPHATKIFTSSGVEISKPADKATATTLKSVPLATVVAQAAPVLVANGLEMVPMTPASSTKIQLPENNVANHSDSDEPLPAQKKTPTWKATLLERRKLIVVEEGSERR